MVILLIFLGKAGATIWAYTEPHYFEFFFKPHRLLVCRCFAVRTLVKQKYGHIELRSASQFAQKSSKCALS